MNEFRKLDKLTRKCHMQGVSTLENFKLFRAALANIQSAVQPRMLRVRCFWSQRMLYLEHKSLSMSMLKLISITLINQNPTNNLSCHTKCPHQHSLEHPTNTFNYLCPHRHPLTHATMSSFKLFTLANHIIY